MNEVTIGCGDGAALSIGTLLGKHGVGSFTGDFEGKVNFFYQGVCKRRFWKRAVLSIGTTLGTWVVGSFTGDSESLMKEGSGNGAYLSREFC